MYYQSQVALCALARLYLMNDDLDQCQYTCMTLLRNDKENEEATVMMADLAFRKNDYEAAMFHFQQLLEKRPDYWVALARLVEVMRRTGHLEDVNNISQTLSFENSPNFDFHSRCPNI